jgi:PAS domain S-box-containing protein
MTDIADQNDDCPFPEKYQCQTYSTSENAAITTNSRGLVTSLNAAAALLTGWTEGDAIGQDLTLVFDIVGRVIGSSVEEESDLRNDAAFEILDETCLRTRDGTLRYIDGDAISLETNKEIVGRLIVFRDVTRRVMRGNRLKDEIGFANNIIGSMRLPFLVLDRALTIRMANQAFYNTFQVSHAETEGFAISALGAGQWAKIDVDGLLDSLITGRVVRGSCYVEDHFPLVGERVMRLDAGWMAPDNGSSSLILLTIEDVSDRHHTERVMRNSELRYRRLFESAKDGILILDAKTLVIIDANPFITQLLGYSYGDLIGRELWEIGFFGDKVASQTAYAELQDSGYVRYDYLPLKTRAGERAEVEFISNVYMVAGQPIAQCNIRDISERVRMDLALKEQAKTLTDLHRQKDEFLAMLSHELRNPLAPITNAVRLLRLHDAHDPTMLRACVIIERQLIQLTRLVDDLVEVSRITTGRVQLRTERITIQEVVEHAVETTRPLLDQRKHELSVSMGQSPIWVDGDASRLEQVMVNLLANAAKYTDEGGHIDLTVELENDACVLRLRDTGVGIAPELLPHIFELFTQAERSLDRSRGGLGIGLALVQRIVGLHGGSVDVHSVLEEGTEFVVRLPAAISSVIPSPALPAETSLRPAGSLRVLVVDDNLDTAESMTMLVEMLGHTVKTEHDGNSALRTAFDFHPDVVLLDIGLPGLNGYEVASRIRQQPSLNHTILAAITGYGHESDRQLALKAGIDHHLVKPVDFERVRRILLTASESRLPSVGA